MEHELPPDCHSPSHTLPCAAASWAKISTEQTAQIWHRSCGIVPKNTRIRPSCKISHHKSSSPAFSSHRSKGSAVMRSLFLVYRDKTASKLPSHRLDPVFFCVANPVAVLLCQLPLRAFWFQVACRIVRFCHRICCRTGLLLVAKSGLTAYFLFPN